MLKTEGKSYVTISGKVIAEKSLRRACNCRKKCYEQLSDDVRLVIFKHFYSLSQSGQNQFLANNVEESEKKVQRIRGIRKNRSRRKYTRNYFLFENQNRIEVCQTMFLNTLNVSLKKVRVIVEKKTKLISWNLCRGWQGKTSKPSNNTTSRKGFHKGAYPDVSHLQ